MAPETATVLVALATFALLVLVGFLDYHRICRREKVRRHEADLESRIEGLETMLADLMQDGRIIVQLPPVADDALAATARGVDAERHRPHPRGAY